MKKYYPSEQWDARQLESKLVGNFAGAYMTTISIIQGVTFYFIINNSMSIWVNVTDSGINKSTPPLIFLVYPILSFCTLITVAYLYSYFVCVTFRPPSIKDSAFPLILGLTEVIPTFFFNNPGYWWLSFAAFTLFSIAPLLTTYSSVHSDIYDKEVDITNATKKETWKNIIACLLLTILSLGVYGVYKKEILNSSSVFMYYDWIGVASCALIIFYIVWTAECLYLKKIIQISNLDKKVKQYRLNQD